MTLERLGFEVMVCEKIEISFVFITEYCYEAKHYELLGTKTECNFYWHLSSIPLIGA